MLVIRVSMVELVHRKNHHFLARVLSGILVTAVKPKVNNLYDIAYVLLWVSVFEPERPGSNFALFMLRTYHNWFDTEATMTFAAIDKI